MRIDIQAFSDACRDLYAPDLSQANFAERSFRFLRQLIPCEFIACGALDTQQQRLHIALDREVSNFPSAMEALGTLMANYPLYNWDPTVNEGRPFCRSHFFSEREFRDLDIYQEVYLPLGITNHCAIHVPTTKGEVMFFGIERAGGADYSSEELKLLESAQAQLANAHALGRTRAACETESVEPELLNRLGLTPREAETLFWMNEGKSNAEIALVLGLRLYTVKDHVASVFNKTGTGNRLAAIVWARRACRALRQGERPFEGAIDILALPARAS